ncbi:hypothetical protein SKAU_G00334690 [Synaphobranchus kaupii]|uniref:Uncharacterized protein n=1 Tax=Synaphobranchus kaupii TaxID=118154 RepID=A0A9Q1ELU4_SYNKA|nr:hypothetical protein SKAU_G00334690 [Synaphobranchus kaupii]
MGWCRRGLLLAGAHQTVMRRAGEEGKRSQTLPSSGGFRQINQIQLGIFDDVGLSTSAGAESRVYVPARSACGSRVRTASRVAGGPSNRVNR